MQQNKDEIISTSNLPAAPKHHGSWTKHSVSISCNNNRDSCNGRWPNHLLWPPVVTLKEPSSHDWWSDYSVMGFFWWRHFLSRVFDPCELINLLGFQDYLLSHMYGNAAREDLWRKLSQVRLACVAQRHLGSQTFCCCKSLVSIVMWQLFCCLCIIIISLSQSQLIHLVKKLSFRLNWRLTEAFLSRPCVQRGGTLTSEAWWTGGLSKWDTLLSPSARTNQSSCSLVTSPSARSTSCTDRKSDTTTGKIHLLVVLALVCWWG